MNKKTFNQSMKQGLMMIAFCFALIQLKAQTFRIQEHSVNPNCGGTYELYLNGNLISNTYVFNYPNLINNAIPSVPPPVPPASPCIAGPLPDQIKFRITNCSGSIFYVNINNSATTVNCNCTGSFANHNFSATLQIDPINQCNYLLDIYY